jgi:hypothetical protein
MIGVLCAPGGRLLLLLAGGAIVAGGSTAGGGTELDPEVPAAETAGAGIDPKRDDEPGIMVSINSPAGGGGGIPGGRVMVAVGGSTGGNPLLN